MNNEVKHLKINLKDFVIIALEIWRMTKIVNEKVELSQNVGLRYSLRKTKRTIESNKIIIKDLTGEKYDSGMAVDVIDSVKSKVLDDLYILETIEPIVMYDNQVVKRGKVILDLI